MVRHDRRGPNLTRDKEAGLGDWTDAQVATALTAGKRPEGRELAPVMPWHAIANLTKEDVAAIVAFLRTVPAVKNKVPGPFGPKEEATSFVMNVVPGGAMKKQQVPLRPRML